jgi:hypothetical protein
MSQVGLKDRIFRWAKSKSWYFWFIVILTIIAIIILICDRGDHKMGDLSLLDDEHIRECEEVIEDNTEDEQDQVDYLETPTKRKWKREDICREVFESIYQKPFKSCRPHFLKNPRTGRNLELDGYNEELGIAFEHNGRQHYEYPNTFHKTKQDFYDQHYRDQYKRKACDDNDVYLIVIPFHVPEKDIRQFIISKLPNDY